jgi:hypothetical protein
VNVEEFSRPILKKARRVERPTSHVSKSLPFVDIEFAVAGHADVRRKYCLPSAGQPIAVASPRHPSSSLVMPGPKGKFYLWFAKILADFEINNLAAALPPLFCYNS